MKGVVGAASVAVNIEQGEYGHAAVDAFATLMPFAFKGVRTQTARSFKEFGIRPTGIKPPGMVTAKEAWTRIARDTKGDIVAIKKLVGRNVEVRKASGSNPYALTDQQAEEFYQSLRTKNSTGVNEEINSIVKNTKRYVKDSSLGNEPENFRLSAVSDETYGEVIGKVRKHLLTDEHRMPSPQQPGEYVTGRFTADESIAKLWQKAIKGNLEGDELLEFQRTIAHEYLEHSLERIGMPYKSSAPEISDFHRGQYFYNQSPTHYGAHDLSPIPGNLVLHPYSHWRSLLGIDANLKKW